MTTTARNVTEAQLSQLRSEAAEAGDFVQVAMCDLALDGSIDGDDYTTLSREETRRVTSMSQAEAVQACVEAICSAEAQ